MNGSKADTKEIVLVALKYQGVGLTKAVKLLDSHFRVGPPLFCSEPSRGSSTAGRLPPRSMNVPIMLKRLRLAQWQYSAKQCPIWRRSRNSRCSAALSVV